VTAEPLLAVEGITKMFGGLKAIDDVSLSVWRGSVVGVVGPNGAGKSTLFNLVCGVDRPDKGRVRFKGRDLTGMACDAVARLGLVRTFQHSRVFGEMTVEDNVLAGGFSKQPGSLGRRLLRWFRQDRERAKQIKCDQLLNLVGLRGKEHQLAGSLAYGDQRKLEVARALAAEPDLLMLDEPAAGLSRDEIDELGEVIKGVRELGKSVVLIEHDVPMVAGLSDEIFVLDHGEKIAGGTPQEVMSDQRVITAYLGKGRRC
jgi:branched-chain amino acid transport system ATP-binding protein